MPWFVLAVAAPALWALSNHIDKYMLDQRRGVGALMIYSAAIGLAIMPLIALLQPHVFAIGPAHGALMIANGALYILSLLPYYYALQRDETSTVVPLFQSTTIFSYLLGLIFLGEQLSWLQIAAALLIILGSVTISLEYGRRRPRFKADVFWLMLLAALLNALNWFLFKYIAIQEDFWVSSFWEYAGFALAGAGLLLGVKPYRDELRASLRAGRWRLVGLVSLNETISISAKIATNIASLVAPLALIATAHSLQPLFAFGYALLLTRFLPRYGSERLSRPIVLQRLVAILLIIAGSWALSG